ncbi:MAG: MoxR family ATPase [Roseiflexaceae bacterium]
MSLTKPHDCPNTGAAVAPVTRAAVAQIDEAALRAMISAAVAAMPPVTVQPHLTVAAPQVTVETTIDTDALATALGRALGQALAEQPAAQGGVVQLDTTALAAALLAGMPQQTAGTAQFDAKALAHAIKSGMPQHITAQFDATALADALRAGLPQAPHITVQLDTAALAEALGQLPAPIMDTSAFTAALQATLHSVAGGNLQAVAPITAAVPDPAAAQAMIQMAQAAQRMSDLAERLAQGGQASASTTAVAALAAAAAPAERLPREGLIRPEGMPLTAQEHILSPVILPAPDPYLMDVDPAVGGRRSAALAEYIPDLDANYEIGETNERILRAMSAALQAGQKGDQRRSFWSRAFGLYGPAGTGKNTLARQLAASVQTVDTDGNVSQGLNYTEYNVLPDSTLEDAIGTVVLEPDGRGGTRSRVKLGKIGLAAAMGSVICINEIARSEKLATALQSILEDGEIIIGSPEAGMTRIPVHPATITCMTWNPGNEGDPDRPAAAPLSRIMPFELPKATAKERGARVGGFLKQFQPSDAAPANTDAQRDAEREQLRQTILRKEYKVPQDITVSDRELEAAVNFIQDIESLAGTGAMDRQIGLNSRTPTRPGDRQLRNYIVLGKTVGWKEAAQMFRICCDQNDQFDEQWRLVLERFEAHFGTDGNAPSRKAARAA